MKKKLLATIFAIFILIVLIYQLYISNNIGFKTELINLKFFFIPMWSACLITTIFTPIIIFTLIQDLSFSSFVVSKKK